MGCREGRGVTVAEAVEEASVVAQAAELSWAELEALRARRHEPFDLERCFAVDVEWGSSEEYPDPDDAPQHLVTQVACRNCEEKQPTPNRANPSCVRCGTWLLRNKAL